MQYKINILFLSTFYQWSVWQIGNFTNSSAFGAFQLHFMTVLETIIAAETTTALPTTTTTTVKLTTDPATTTPTPTTAGNCVNVNWYAIIRKY